MTNYCFKNAVIRKNDSFEPSWPCLEYAKNKSRKSFKNKFKKLATPECKAEQHNLQVNEQKEVHSSVPMFGVEGSSSSCNASIRNNKPQKDDFPELSTSTSISKKICTSRPNICTVKCVNHNSLQDSKSNLKNSFKHSRHKHGVASVPLMSFIKPAHVKMKQTFKSSCNRQNVYCGNKLDGDRPVRCKGKVRLTKKKYETRLKKEIILSRQIKKKGSIYDQDMIKIKCLIPSIIDNYKGQVNINKLETLLASLKIVETEKQNPEAENKINMPNDINESGLCKVSIDGDYSASSREAQQPTRQLAKNILHSQTFKPYCTNVVNRALLNSVEKFILALRHFQDRQHAKNPIKALAKRRYICGFKETKKFLLADKIKLVIIATNLQLDADLPSGHILEEINSLCNEKNIAVIFAGKGNQIGYWTLKRRRISVVSILNYDGVEDHFREVMTNWEQCKNMYVSLLEEIEACLAVNGSENKDIHKQVEEEIREKILSKLSLDSEDS